MVSFFKEVQAEMKKVHWPTRTDIIKMTTLVVVISIAVGLYIGGIDYGLALLMGQIV